MLVLEAVCSRLLMKKLLHFFKKMVPCSPFFFKKSIFVRSVVNEWFSYFYFFGLRLCSLNSFAGIIANTRLLYFIYALVLAKELDLD